MYHVTKADNTPSRNLLWPNCTTLYTQAHHAAAVLIGACKKARLGAALILSAPSLYLFISARPNFYCVHSFCPIFGVEKRLSTPKSA